MNRRTVTILGVLGFVIAVVAIVIYVVLHRIPVFQASDSYSVPSNFSNAVAYDTNSFLYTNGRAFIVYNYANGQSKTIGPDMGIPTLAHIDSLSLSTDQQYILFHNELVTNGDILYSQLKQRGLNTTKDYWWVFNVNNSSFFPLPQGVLRAKMDGNYIYTLSKGDVSEYITTYDASTVQQIKSLPVPNSTDFFVTQGAFLLQTFDNKILLTSDGIVSKLLFPSTTIVNVTPNKKFAIGVQTQNKIRKLVELNLGNYSTKAVASGVVGDPTWINTGKTLYTLNTNGPNKTPRFYSYDTSTHIVTFWELTGLAKDSSVPVALVGESTAVVSDTFSNYYLIGSGLTPIK